jgi:dTDP-glucose pyrophosphorylase
MMNILIPMAGLGSRFKKTHGALPKPLIEVDGLSLIEHSIKSFDVPGRFIFVTRRFDDQQYNVRLSALLQSLKPDSIEICLDTITAGASQTCLAAREYINNDQPLVIYNCDQIIRWKPQDFLDYVDRYQCDGAVVLYNSNDPKNSFAVIDNGTIVQLVEKQAVSNHALIGFHYWKQGSDFVHSADNLMTSFHVSGRPECYVSETYNFLIEQGATIQPYHVTDNMFIPLGTPNDVNRYLGKIKEFYTKKPKTLFCDIDGSILKHAHVASDVISGTPLLLDGVAAKFNQWDSQGHKIILVTARKESMRDITTRHLQQLGLVWDQLIMGVGGGTRYIINDKLMDGDADRAVAVNVITDGGFERIDWDALDL